MSQVMTTTPVTAPATGATRLAMTGPAMAIRFSESS
jgi:hypothetical protein